MDQLSYRNINFEEFCAAATGPYRLEPLEKLEQISANHLSVLNRRETLMNLPRPKLESVPADVLSNSSSPEMPAEAYTAKNILKSLCTLNMMVKQLDLDLMSHSTLHDWVTIGSSVSLVTQLLLGCTIDASGRRDRVF